MKSRFLSISIAIIYAACFVAFYYKYVPRTHIFFLILSSLTLFFIVSTVISLRFGTLGIVFLIPIVSSLPYFFNIRGINPLIIVFLGYLFGIFVHQIIHPTPLKFSGPIFLPIYAASIIVIVSSLITLWRYSNFFPVSDTSIYELTVNVINIKAGEAIRRVILDSLNYLAGFIWFGIIISVLSTKKLVQKAVSLLAFSSSIALLFGLYQLAKDPNLGNLEFFVEFNRINGLFSDPNAFGVYLALSLSLFMGALLTIKKKQKYLLFIPILLGIFLLPHIGSRSGLLGVVFSVVFFLSALVKILINSKFSNPQSRRKMLAYLVLIIFVVTVISFLSFSIKGSVLYKRLEWDRYLFSVEDIQAQILKGRQYLWKAAFHMIKEFPLNGIGVGSFMIELPNYYQKYNIFPVKSPSYYQTAPAHDVLIDTAGNYYLHVGAELGMIGLFLFCSIFYLLLRRIFLNNFRRKIVFDGSYFIAGLSAGIFSIIVIFFLGIHTINFEIQLAFWLMIGLFFTLDPSENKKASFTLRKKIAFGSIIMVFAVSHLWNSTHSLSLQSRSLDLGLIQSFGLYQIEKMNGKEFRWSGKNAGLPVVVKKPILIIPILASHPDIQEKPIHVEVYYTKDLFKSLKLIRKIILNENRWQEIELDLSDEIGSEGIIVFKVSRTWQPLKILGTPDPRNLGIAMGKLAYRSSDN